MLPTSETRGPAFLLFWASSRFRQGVRGGIGVSRAVTTWTFGGSRDCSLADTTKAHAVVSVHSESNDETNRAKNIFKEEGAHDISSTGEAHSDVKAEDVSGRAETRVPEVTSRSGLLESDVPSSGDGTLRETERERDL
jgi:hypothetical protein